MLENDPGPGLRDPDAVQTAAAAAAEVVYFIFHLAGRAYALPPEQVELIAPVVKPVPVPTAPAHLRGVVHLRGRILTVVDLAQVLGLDTAAAGDVQDQRLVVVRLADQPFAFVADATAGVCTLPADALSREAAGDRVVAGHLKWNTTTVTVLYGPALLAAVLGQDTREHEETRP